MSYRVFLSYRGESTGNTKGKEFSELLYNILKENPAWQDEYGQIYYSPDEPMGSYLLDIPEIMADVEFFVMPLTPEYFNDFWNEERNCPNEDSITYNEIIAALKNENCKFICIDFPGFEDDPSVYKKLFNEDHIRISTVKKIQLDSDDKEEWRTKIEIIAQYIAAKRKGAAQLISQNEPNVFFGFKSDTEDTNKFPFYDKLFDTKRLTLLNYASTAFISSIKIASYYNDSDLMANYFQWRLIHGTIETNIIITDPYSPAAYDAAEYKMYPLFMKKGVSKYGIILENLKKLISHVRKYPEANLNIYLTNIALPYGVMMSENMNPENNHIKVDLYAPVTNNDERRPSFYLLQSNRNTAVVYNFFKDNMINIKDNYSYRFNGHPDISWITGDRFIAHRGVIDRDLEQHTKAAFEHCITQGFPIEIDLLPLSDGAIVVGRDGKGVLSSKPDQLLSECTAEDFWNENQKKGDQGLMFFKDFLEYTAGRIPVLVEIKTTTDMSAEYIEKYVNKVVCEIQKYMMKYSEIYRKNHHTFSHGIAIHSAHMEVVKIVKELDCMIPCGIITTDFSRFTEVAFSDEFIRMHQEGNFCKEGAVDFISCDINYLNYGKISKLKETNNVPVIAWTVDNSEKQHKAQIAGCDNIIIEGNRTYLR